jgi:hypothetical protein
LAGSVISIMNTWVKRILIGLLFGVWLLVMLTPTLAVVLARSGQLEIGSAGGPHTRLFLLQEADNEGLGLERAREVSPPVGLEGSASCLRTTVTYWMWTPGVENQPAEYCQCFDNATGRTIPEMSPACLMP